MNLSGKKNYSLKTRFFLGLFLLSLALFFSASIHAAEDEPVPEEVKENLQLMAIPVSQIERQSARLDDLLKQQDAEMISGQALERDEQDIILIGTELDKLHVQAGELLANRYDSLTLQTLRLNLDNINERLTELMDDMNVRIEGLDAGNDMIRNQQQIWQLTREDAQKSAVPAVVIKRVQDDLNYVKVHLKNLESIRNQVLGLQNQVSTLLGTAETELKLIDDAQAKLDASIFIRQDQFLWQAWATLDQTESFLGGLDDRFIQLGKDLLMYLEKQGDSLFHYGLFIGFIGWSLSKRYALIKQDSQADASELNVLKHPWTLALLLGFYLAPFLFPDRVLAFKLASILIALPLWLRIVGNMLPASFRFSLNTLALLVAIDSMRMAFGGFTVISQWVLALEFILCFITMYRALRIERALQISEQLRKGFWYQLIHGWVKYLTPVIGIGTIAVIFGYTNLAGKIVLPVIWGPIAGGAIFALIRIVEVIIKNMVLEGKLDGLRMIKTHRQTFIMRVTKTLRLTGFLSWCYLILGAIQIWEPFRDSAYTLFTARIGIEPVTFSLGSVLAFALLLWLTWWLSRFIDLALKEDVFPRIKTPPGVPFAVTTFSRYTIMVAGFLAAVSMLGFSMDKLTLLVSALGVGIGFGLQNITSNFISGIILLFERPIRVGDKVQIDDLIGHVSSIGIRASKIANFDGADVIVPNADFISARVINWTFADKKQRIIIPVGVAYGTDPEVVIDLLEKVAADVQDVLSFPVPEVLFQNFGESSLDFELRVWTESERGWLQVKSEVAVAISKSLTAAGIEIPFAQRDVNFRNIPELKEAMIEAIRNTSPSVRKM